MKIRTYIVTYKNPEHLHHNLSTLFACDMSGLDLEVNIINNHTELYLAEEFESRVNVLHNMTRPNFSVGHLSRDWNAGIVIGFEDLTNPACDMVLLSQDDTIWHPIALQAIAHQSNKYSAIFLGNGDCVVAFRPEAIRRIGLWDERYSCNGFHEMDMFLRSAIYNGSETSINDIWHQLLPVVRSNFPRDPYLWNPLPYEATELIYRPDSNKERHEDKNKYSVYHATPRELFKEKWGEYPEYKPLAQMVEEHKNGPIGKSYIMFPYFEKNVYDLEQKGYVYRDAYNWI